MKIHQEFEGATIDALNEAVTVHVADADVIAFDVTGTFTATLTAEASVDGSTFVTITGTNIGSNAAASTLTAAGVLRIANCQGFEKVRLRVSAYTDGAAVVKWQTARTSK
jgi:hypothetical protein